jgi:uncharacterized protein (UPF0548 family)
MFALPDAATVERHLAAQRTLACSYPAIGCTRAVEPPARYNVDANRQLLGRGAATFAIATTAIRAWRMFPAWTAIEPHAPIAVGETIAVLIRALGLWWLNACRIVYVIDEPRRFGFAYGTLPGHAERGEERFSVEWLADDAVWYDIRAISRPRHWAAWLGYPVTRALQRRFARDSKAAMAEACSS